MAKKATAAVAVAERKPRNTLKMRDRIKAYEVLRMGKEEAAKSESWQALAAWIGTKSGVTVTLEQAKELADICEFTIDVKRTTRGEELTFFGERLSQLEARLAATEARQGEIVKTVQALTAGGAVPILHDDAAGGVGAELFDPISQEG